MKTLQRIIIKSEVYKHLEHIQKNRQKDFDNTAQVKNSTSTHPRLRNSFYRNGNLAVHLNCSTIQTNAATKTITNKLVGIHPPSIFLSIITGEGIILT